MIGLWLCHASQTGDVSSIFAGRGKHQVRRHRLTVQEGGALGHAPRGALVWEGRLPCDKSAMGRCGCRGQGGALPRILAKPQQADVPYPGPTKSASLEQGPQNLHFKPAAPGTTMGEGLRSNHEEWPLKPNCWSSALISAANQVYILMMFWGDGGLVHGVHSQQPRKNS